MQPKQLAQLKADLRTLIGELDHAMIVADEEEDVKLYVELSDVYIELFSVYKKLVAVGA